VRGTGSDALIDDFEDGDPILRAVDGRVGGWWVAGDTGCTLDPSNPPTPEFGGASGSALALHVSAAGCDDWGFSTGVSLNSTSPLACAYDAKAYDGVYFWARTAVAPLSVQVAVNTRQTIPLAYGGDGTCGDACWNSYSIWFDVDPTWRLYAFTWAELAQQPGWGTAVPFDVTAIEQITWGATAAQTVNPRADLWIDQVNFVLGPVPLPPPNL
jgi:hypothetical protein